MSSSPSSALVSKALVPCTEPLSPEKPLSPEEFLRKRMEAVTNEVFRRSMEIAKFEKDHLVPIDLDPQIVREARHRRLCQVLPPLEGPHKVGYTSMVIERPEGDLEGDRKIGIEIYAPTHEGKGDKLFMHRAKDFSLLSEKQLQTLHSHCVDHLRPKGSFPILIFSHGLGVDPIEYRLLLENLASQGYVVVNLNHPTSSGYAPFSEEVFDESALDELSEGEIETEINKLALKQEANIKFIIDKIRTGKMLERLGLSDQIVLAGHSLGGAASILVSRDDHDVKGSINLDGLLMGDEEAKTEGIEAPVLIILSEKKHDPKAFRSMEEYVESQKMSDRMVDEIDTLCRDSEFATKLLIEGTDHMSFCLVDPMKGWLLDMADLEGPLKAHHITSQEIVKFMKTIS
jgi:dienelactone hydrolase